MNTYTIYIVIENIYEDENKIINVNIRTKDLTSDVIRKCMHNLELILKKYSEDEEKLWGYVNTFKIHLVVECIEEAPKVIQRPLKVRNLTSIRTDDNIETVYKKINNNLSSVLLYYIIKDSFIVKDGD